MFNLSETMLKDNSTATINDGLSNGIAQLLFLCLMAVISNILSWLHNSYNKTIPLAKKNVLTQISTYFVSSISNNASIHCAPFIISFIFGPVSSLMALLIEIILTASGCVMYGLGTLTALMKVLMVTHFDWCYSQDPEELSRKSVGTVYVLAISLSLSVNWPDVAAGRIRSTLAASLSNQPEPDNQSSQLTPGLILSLVWIIIYLLSTLAAKIVIAHVLRKRCRCSSAIKIAERSENYARENGLPMRALVLAVTIIAVILAVRLLDGLQFVDSKSKTISSSSMASSVIVNCILCYFVSSPKIVKYIKRSMFARMFSARPSRIEPMNVA
jgi:hypothetical protein